jgi:hypothetical protein
LGRVAEGHWSAVLRATTGAALAASSSSCSPVGASGSSGGGSQFMPTTPVQDTPPPEEDGATICSFGSLTLSPSLSPEGPEAGLPCPVAAVR